MKKWLKRFGILLLILIVFSTFGNSENSNTVTSTPDNNTTEEPIKEKTDEASVSPEVQKSIDEKYELQSEVDYAIRLTNDRIGEQNGFSRLRIIQFLEGREYSDEIIEEVLVQYNADWSSLAYWYIQDTHMSEEPEEEIVNLLERQLFTKEEIEYAIDNLN